MTDELSLAQRLLERAVGAGAEVEVAVDHHRLALTRFANSAIHQNVADDIVGLRVTVHRDGRTASGSGTGGDGDGVEALVDRILAAVTVAPVDTGWPGIAPAAPTGTPAEVDPAAAGATPDERASIVAAFVEAAGGLETAGFCRTGHWSGAFVNSTGQEVTGERADVAVDGIARLDGADGVARAASGRLADLDGAVLGARAAAKARAGADAEELAPDRYEVVLEPTAVADVLHGLSWYGFNAKAVEERRSFVRLGEAQFDPAITIVDDAAICGDAYDAEGTPCRRTVLIEAGTSASLTHDRRTAAAAGAESTGHSVGAPSFGGVATHVGLLPVERAGAISSSEVDGPVVDAAAAELVAGVERGILVTDLWYTRVLDPRTLAITGLTRNGVWLIERGEVVRPLRNFRFTQSYAQALTPGAVRGIGRFAHALPGDTYSAAMPRWTAPALHLASWNFTGGASG
ncbi:MAG: TldD/PmbA family protein [Ilumatobacteraceae bacterium]